MSEVLIDRDPHSCYDSLPFAQNYGDGSLARCECGRHFVLRDQRWRSCSRRKALKLLRADRAVEVSL